MFTLEEYGRALTHQKVVPGNTITSLNKEMYVYTERTLAFTSGGTTEIVVGDWIVGATSTAKAKVVAISALTGATTWAGGDAAGTFTLSCQHGTFQSENIKVAAGTDDATIAANSKIVQIDYPNKGMEARAVLVVVTAQTALCAWDGGKPDQTALVGVPIAAGSAIVLTNNQSIRDFKCVDAVAASASTVNVVYYF